MKIFLQTLLAWVTKGAGVVWRLFSVQEQRYQIYVKKPVKFVKLENKNWKLFLFYSSLSDFGGGCDVTI